MAFDSLTNSIARVLGRLTGGAVLETLGLDDAFPHRVALYLVAGLVFSGFDFRREARKLRFARIAIDITEGLAVARTNPAILAVRSGVCGLQGRPDRPCSTRPDRPTHRGRRC